MNDSRIKDYVDNIFRNVMQSGKVAEQKEELTVNLAEKVQDYMRGGMSFDAAFETAKSTVGDIGELTAPFEKNPSYGFGSQTPPVPVEEEPRGSRLTITWGYGIVGLAVLAYVFIGLLQNRLYDFIPFLPNMINWWAWGWIMIPGSAILCTPMRWTTKLVSLSPFIYLLLGFWFGMWAWGWMIIPIAGVLEAGVIKVSRE